MPKEYWNLAKATHTVSGLPQARRSKNPTRNRKRNWLTSEVWIINQTSKKSKNTIAFTRFPKLRRCSTVKHQKTTIVFVVLGLFSKELSPGFLAQSNPRYHQGKWPKKRVLKFVLCICVHGQWRRNWRRKLYHI